MGHLGSFLRASLGIAAVTLAIGAALALCGPGKPTTIAVVDLESVYNKLDQHAAAEAKLGTLVDGMNLELTKRQDELTLIQEVDLKTLTKGSQAYEEALAKAETAVAKYRAYKEFAEAKTAAESERLLKGTYDDVKNACAAVAKENGIHLVLLDDASPDFSSQDQRPMMQQISARRSLFVDPVLDITQCVIDRMNADFKARGGVVPARTNPPPAVGAGAAAPAEAGAAPPTRPGGGTP